MIASFSILGALSIIFSITLLLADENNERLIEVKGVEAGNKTDLKEILLENSILDEDILDVEGVASHYGKRFHQRKTASGERYNMHEYSAAHRNLPFGTILKVTNLFNNRSTLVRINDRGPFIRKRILDLSLQSATDIEGKGLPKIKIEGFVRGKVDIPEPMENDYLFAYSINSKPMVIPSNFLNIRHSFNDFNSAVVYYKELIESGLTDSSETFIVFDENTFNSFDDNEVYHIATWRPVLYRKIPVMMAEKIYSKD